MMWRLAVPLALAPLVTTPAGGQTWLTVTEARRHMREESLTVHVEFGLGRLHVVPADGPALFRVGLVYDDDHFDPDVRYDAARRRLTAGIDKDDDHGIRFDYEDSQQRLNLALSPAVPVSLYVEFGAGAATLDLGGLSLSSARIQTGASESTVSFSSPNVGTCSRLWFEVGAAQFRGEQLGNARCESIRVSGGIGEIRLDLSGAWNEGEHRIRADVGLGEVRIDVPRDAGVRLRVHKFLAGVDHPGFTKRGSYYYSPNYEAAAVKLHLEVHATFGSIEIGWTDR